MKVLHCYANLTKGGMGTVMRARAITNPQDSFDYIFGKDLGGGDIFSDLSNIQVRVVRPDRQTNYLEALLRQHSYSEIRMTSLPSLANHVFPKSIDTFRVYEFHTSDARIIKNEIVALDLSNVDELRVPTETLKSTLLGLLPQQALSKVQVFPNEIDPSVFYPGQPETNGEAPKRLIWVGQFSQAKGFRDFARLLGVLGESYFGEMYFSGAISQESTKDLLREFSNAGVSDRIQIFKNFSQGELADHYRSLNGEAIFVSTSLIESFGYGVYEALRCGLPVAAYSVPALREFEEEFPTALKFADIGEITELADVVESFRNTNHW